MNSLRTLCAALTLALCLAVPAAAGEIGCGIAPPPPSQSPAAAESSIGEMALSLIQSVLSLF